jgi:hypothetical protein
MNQETISSSPKQSKDDCYKPPYKPYKSRYGYNIETDNSLNAVNFREARKLKNDGRIDSAGELLHTLAKTAKKRFTGSEVEMQVNDYREIVLEELFNVVVELTKLKSPDSRGIEEKARYEEAAEYLNFITAATHSKSLHEKAVEKYCEIVKWQLMDPDLVKRNPALARALLIKLIQKSPRGHQDCEKACAQLFDLAEQTDDKREKRQCYGVIMDSVQNKDSKRRVSLELGKLGDEAIITLPAPPKMIEQESKEDKGPRTSKK